MDKEYSNEYVKYVFTEEEKKEIATEMAQKVSERNRLEDDKKAVMSDFKSQIDRVQAEINGSATKLNNGYEMRSVKCEVERDYKKKIATYFRTDTGEIAKTRRMTPDELQLQLVK